ncbi:MAG: DUF4252 domain-containing protein [Bacteroidota bacterium]
MRTLTTLILIAFISITTVAQTGVNKLFEKYENDERFTKVNVNSRMFSLFTELEPGDENEEEFLEAISKIEGLKVLSADSIDDAEKHFKDAVASLKGKGYEELMSVKDADQDVFFYIQESKGIINELLLVAGGGHEFNLVTLYGEIDLKKISRISKSLNIKGLDKLKNLDGN